MAVASSRDRTKEFADTVRSLQGRNMNGHAGFKQVRPHPSCPLGALTRHPLIFNLFYIKKGFLFLCLF